MKVVNTKIKSLICFLLFLNITYGQTIRSRALENEVPIKFKDKLNDSPINLKLGQRIAYKTNSGNYGVMEVIKYNKGNSLKLRFITQDSIILPKVRLNNYRVVPYKPNALTPTEDLIFGRTEKIIGSTNNLDLKNSQILGIFNIKIDQNTYQDRVRNNLMDSILGLQNKPKESNKEDDFSINFPYRAQIPLTINDSLSQEIERITQDVRDNYRGEIDRNILNKERTSLNVSSSRSFILYPKNGAKFALINSLSESLVTGVYRDAISPDSSNSKVFYLLQIEKNIIGYYETIDGNKSGLFMESVTTFNTNVYNNGTLISIEGNNYVLSNSVNSSNDIKELNYQENCDLSNVYSLEQYNGDWFFEGTIFKVKVKNNRILIYSINKKNGTERIGIGFIQLDKTIKFLWSLSPRNRNIDLNEKPIECKLRLIDKYSIRAVEGNFMFVPEIKRKLCGWVDMHTHPMSYLGFGKKAMHGTPDIGSLLPPGMISCKTREGERTSSIDEALGNCNPSHGGKEHTIPFFNDGDTVNFCGNYKRAAIINHALDSDFVHKTKNLHGDHQHEGYPNLRYWPHQSSILHQQMWFEWVERAHQNGLRVIVALTVNSQLLAEVLEADEPKDDATVADLQIDETIRFVNRHSNFMEIARSANDLRRIISQGKLAVVLGMEIDNIGNFNRLSRPLNEAIVRRELLRLYERGIRYIFPIHLVDNDFGGSAVYEVLFNMANKKSSGNYFEVETDRSTQADMALLPDIPKIFRDHLFELSGLGVYPSYEDIEKGHVNQKGLTNLGEFAIREMMRMGMLIDIDHMSQKTVNEVLSIAKENDYPVNSGHNGVRPSSGGTERSLTASQYNTISDLGGLAGLGTADSDPFNFIANYNLLYKAMKGKQIAIGSDANGFERLPRSTGRNYDNFYIGFSKCSTGNRTWDYQLEGVAHYGLMPDFFREISFQWGGEDIINNLNKSSEYFAQMWEKCEEKSRTIPRE